MPTRKNCLMRSRKIQNGIVKHTTGDMKRQNRFCTTGIKSQQSFVICLVVILVLATLMTMTNGYRSIANLGIPVVRILPGLPVGNNT